MSNQDQKQCWYCEAQGTDEHLEYMVHEPGAKETVKIDVPRCAACRTTQKRAFIAMMGVSFGVNLVALGAGVAMIAVSGWHSFGLATGAAIALVTTPPSIALGFLVYRLILSSKGTKAHRHGLRHPDIQTRLDGGFRLGPR